MVGSSRVNLNRLLQAQSREEATSDPSFSLATQQTVRRALADISSRDDHYFLRVQESLNEQTKKLFKAIDDKNLEDFEKALREGADVNAFDSDHTPLMTIVVNLATCSNQAIEKKYYSMIRSLLLHDDIDVNIYDNNVNTASHLATCYKLKKAVQLLLIHPSARTYLNDDAINYHSTQVQLLLTHLRDDIDHDIQMIHEKQRELRYVDFFVSEMSKARVGRDLLWELSRKSCDIHRVKRFLEQELNPNCWEKVGGGTIGTPLGYIIWSCTQLITQDKKDVLIKLLKHEELDFSQVKPIHDIEHNPALKQIIKQALKERLVSAIDSKDLDNVKKLVEDNWLMNYTIVIDALDDAETTIESIQNYLNEKLAPSWRDLSNKNKKLSEASTQSRKQGNYASIFLVLSGVSAVCACLTTLQMEICILFASVAFIFLAIGCYYSYKANTALECVKIDQFIDNAPNINA